MELGHGCTSEQGGVERGADPRGCSSSNPLLTSVNLSQTPSPTGDVDLRSPWSKWEMMRRSSSLKASGPLGSIQETPFHLSGKIVEGVSEVEGGRFVGCDGSLNAFAKREFPPRRPKTWSLARRSICRHIVLVCLPLRV